MIKACFPNGFFLPYLVGMYANEKYVIKKTHRKITDVGEIYEKLHHINCKKKFGHFLCSF